MGVVIIFLHYFNVENDFKSPLNSIVKQIYLSYEWVQNWVKLSFFFVKYSENPPNNNDSPPFLSISQYTQILMMVICLNNDLAIQH